MTALAAALDRLTVKLMVPAPSLTVTSLMENWGAPSLSVMVAVPVAAVVVAPETGVAVRVKVSLASDVPSSVVARRSCTEVDPAGMLTLPVTGVHTGVAVVPLLNSSVPVAAVSVPRVAEPLLRLGVKTTAVVLALEMLTVKTAGAPSTTLMSATDKTGLSLSAGVPGGTVPVPSSLMVPTPRLSAIEALVAVTKLTLKVSTPSNTVSLEIAMVTVCVVTPGAKVSEPAVAV